MHTCHCGAETRRTMECGNCTAKGKWNYNKTERLYMDYWEAHDIHCEDCGQSNIQTLRLMHRTALPKGAVMPYTIRDMDTQFLDMLAHPDQYFVRCFNCQDRFMKSPGRPRIFTDLEKMQREDYLRDVSRGYGIKKRKALRDKVLSLYPSTCAMCDLQAIRVLWVGEKGQGPKEGTWAQSRKRIVSEASYRLHFAQFCGFHPEDHVSKNPPPRVKTYEPDWSQPYTEA